MMKHLVWIVLVIAMLCAFAGCSAQTASQQPTQNVAIGNPWSDWASLKEAEHAVGYELNVPESVGETYAAVRYRTMAGAMTLLEVVYSDGTHEVTVRKTEGEGEDISGVYGHDTTEIKAWNGVSVIYGRAAEGDSLKITFDYGGYSWSLYARDGISEGALDSFLTAMLG